VVAISNTCSQRASSVNKLSEVRRSRTEAWDASLLLLGIVFFLKLFMYSQVHATVTVETYPVLMSLSSERYTTFFASHVYTVWNLVYELNSRI
jgi:hypothetical protein